MHRVLLYTLFRCMITVENLRDLYIVNFESKNYAIIEGCVHNFDAKAGTTFPFSKKKASEIHMCC
jgi:hypothetical protein